MSFTKPTVLILGAGSSMHLGYPSGENLVDQISFASLAGSGIKDALRQYNPLSIDRFLQLNPDYSDTGLRFIFFKIHQQEELGILFNKRNSFNISGQSRTFENWYRLLFEAITAGCQTALDLENSLKNLTIITFNYDMSLDAYLYTLLSKVKLYKSGFESAIKFLNIQHVYGSLYNFENIKKDPNFYGSFHTNNQREEDQYHNSLDLNHESKIFTIGKEPQGQEIEFYKTIRYKIGNAEKVIFLGYGFDETNNELLNLENNLKPANRGGGEASKEIYYTNYEQSKIIDQTIGRLINRNTGVTANASIKDCYGALRYDFKLN